MNNLACPMRAVNQSCRTDGEVNTVVAEESSLCAAIAAQVEIDVRTIFVGTTEAILGAHRVSLLGAQIVNHDNDACSCIAQRVSGGVRLTSDPPASATGRSTASTRTHAVEILTYGGTEALPGVKATSRPSTVAIARAFVGDGSFICNLSASGSRACRGWPLFRGSGGSFICSGSACRGRAGSVMCRASTTGSSSPCRGGAPSVMCRASATGSSSACRGGTPSMMCRTSTSSACRGRAGSVMCRASTTGSSSACRGGAGSVMCRTSTSSACRGRVEVMCRASTTGTVAVLVDVALKV